MLIRGDDGLPAALDLPSTGANQVIATADEPEHAVHRALAQPRLAAARIAALEPQMREWVREALDRWLGAGGGDFVPIAETIPARALAHVLGLPDGDVTRFRRWAMMGGDMLAGDVSAARWASSPSRPPRWPTTSREHLGRRRRGASRRPMRRSCTRSRTASRRGRSRSATRWGSRS